MKASRRIKVLIANPGLDVHDAGAKYVSQVLMDAGMEVIYLGIRQTVDGIVNAAIQEDADIIGLSILSGRYDTVVPRVLALLKKRGAEDMKVVVGGIIPQDEIEGLLRMGVRKVFLPGTSGKDIEDYIKTLVRMN